MTDQIQLDQLCIGPKEVRLAKEFFGWDPDSQFYVPKAFRLTSRPSVAVEEQPSLPP